MGSVSAKRDDGSLSSWQAVGGAAPRGAFAPLPPLPGVSGSAVLGRGVGKLPHASTPPTKYKTKTEVRNPGQLHFNSASVVTVRRNAGGPYLAASQPLVHSLPPGAEMASHCLNLQ